MKTNLTDLMQRAATVTKELNRLYDKIYSGNTNKKTIELNGQEQILSKIDDFDETLEKYKNLVNIAIYFRGVIDNMNNTFKLDNGMTIKQAIIQNQHLNNELYLLNFLSDKKEKKVRISETTNSYFEVTTPAYNPQKLKEEAEILKNKIQQTETEIISLNSKEFELDDDYLQKLGYID